MAVVVQCLPPVFSTRRTSAVKKTTPPAPPALLSTGLRRFLYVTAALTGAVILVVEILGAKMLAPYFGTSHFVWTAQIGVTLLSLAAGYWFGGWLVGRTQKLAHLYFCLAGAAVYLGVVVLLCEPVSYACLKAAKLAVGSLLASAFLFFVPLTLLAATGPFVIRMLTSSVDEVGGQVGRLSAVSTVGSVAGTVLIGYVLIPFLPNSVTMLVTACVLLALVVVYLAVWGGIKAAKVPVLLSMLAVGGIGGIGVARDLGWHKRDSELLLRANSNFGELHVIRSRSTGHLYYLNDFLTQNGLDPQNHESIYLFTYMLHGLATAYTESMNDVLCIGLGVGIAPMQFAADGCRVDVAEINPAIVPVAEQFFGLEPSRLNIHIADGRAFLRECGRKYDAVVLDAFLGDSSPSHLMTREAFESIRSVMKPEGVLVINSFGDLEQGRDFFTASLQKTLGAVFRSVKIHSGVTGNIFLVASDRDALEFLRTPPVTARNPTMAGYIQMTYDNVASTSVESGMVLTDDFNPAEVRDAANREAIRRRLALAMKDR